MKSQSQTLTIVRALESGMDCAIPIAEHTGIGIAGVYARLHELMRLGAVCSFRVMAAQPKECAHPTEQRKRYRLRAGTWA